MLKIRLLIAIVAAISLSQYVPAFGQSENSEVVFPAGGVGKQCDILLKNQKPKTSTKNSGTVVSVNEEFIVLSNATRTVRCEAPDPWLVRVLGMGGLFKNVSIAVERVQGELKVPRAEIARITIVEKNRQGQNTRVDTDFDK